MKKGRHPNSLANLRKGRENRSNYPPVFKTRNCPRCDKVFTPIGPSGHCRECQPIIRAEARHRYDDGETARRHYQRYRATQRYRQYTKERYHKMEPNKKKARYTVSNAVRDGRLIRPNVCEKCGRKDWGISRSMIEANHHRGYEPENWLVVEWLCTDCHKLADGFVKIGKGGVNE